MEYVKKGFSFLTEPTKSFDAEKKTSTGEAFKYMLVLAIIIAFLGALVSAVSVGFANIFIPPEAAAFTNPLFIFVTVLVTFYMGIIIGSFVWGLWLHLWAYIMGAKNGLEQTLKSVFYGGTPNYLLGWIPLVGLITAVWSFVLTGIGLMRLHGITGGKAALAIIIAIIIPLAIIGLVFATLLVSLMSLGIFQQGTMPVY